MKNKLLRGVIQWKDELTTCARRSTLMFGLFARLLTGDSLSVCLAR